MIIELKKRVRKVFSNFRRFSSTSQKPKDSTAFPDYICLEVTNACNLRCIHCLYKGGTTENYQGKVGFIDVNFSKKILDELSVYKAGVMLNGDGEALLHPHFHDIARYAVSLNLPNTYFNTNGTLLNRNFVDEFVTYYKGAISVSLDGFKESHERIRKGSSYDLVVNNLNYLNEHIRKHNLPIELSVAYCNYDQPSGERQDFVKYWLQHVNKVTVCEVYDKDYKIISNRINKVNNRERVMCRVPWETFIVKWNGFVIPCSNCFALDEDSDITLGDATQYSLKEIWNGNNLAKFRDRLEKWQIAGSVCENCERWNMYVLLEEEKDNDVIIKRSAVFNTYIKISE